MVFFTRPRPDAIAQARRHPIAFFALFFPIRALLRTVLARAQTGGCVSIRIRRSLERSCYSRFSCVGVCVSVRVLAPSAFACVISFPFACRLPPSVTHHVRVLAPIQPPLHRARHSGAHLVRRGPTARQHKHKNAMPRERTITRAHTTRDYTTAALRRRHTPQTQSAPAHRRAAAYAAHAEAAHKAM